ncbi:unnamed protein product [Closterium sp. NIES-54]
MAGRRAHLQAREEGSDAVADRRHSEGLARYRVGVGRHWQQGPAHSQSSRERSEGVIGLAPEIPEDLYHLIKKAQAVRKHLERNRKDKDSKFRLILIESRVHRLARYYKWTKKLPPNWKYNAQVGAGGTAAAGAVGAGNPVTAGTVKRGKKWRTGVALAKKAGGGHPVGKGHRAPGQGHHVKGQPVLARVTVAKGSSPPQITTILLTPPYFPMPSHLPFPPTPNPPPKAALRSFRLRGLLLCILDLCPQMQHHARTVTRVSSEDISILDPEATARHQVDLSLSESPQHRTT